MAIKLLLGLAAIILVAFVYVAAPSVVVGDSDSDNLDAIVEKLGDIDVRLKAYELRVALDSYPIITGAGSAQSYAAKLNKPVNIADGHTLTVTAAGIVEKPREVDLPRSQRNTPPGFDLVRVSVMIQTPNAYNGETRFFTCEYDGHDTLATFL